MFIARATKLRLLISSPFATAIHPPANKTTGISRMLMTLCPKRACIFLTSTSKSVYTGMEFNT